MKRPRALRFATGKVRTVAHRTGTAAEVIGPLEDGLQVTGVTAGQFSSIDALEHIANEIGPAEALVSTWTTGVYDVHRAAALRANERLLGVRMLLDRGTFEKSPKYAGPLIKALGVDAFRCLSVHAKVTILVRPDGFGAVMRSSMNLNKNLRTEQFDLSVGGPAVDFYRLWFEGLWAEAGRSQDNREIIAAVYDRFLELPPLEDANSANVQTAHSPDDGLSGLDLGEFGL